MATTTPNFGWPVPTSTDLVKDGATAIEALGDAIDASLVDLEGGTTGQILAKASNTDMDFTWITNDVGDITAVTAGTGITGGGTSGAVTVSFDQANFGGGQFAAGKNKIINGDFSVNQRNFSSTTTSAEYNFDRWRTIYTGGTSTTTAQTFTLGTAPVAGYEGKNYYRIAITGQSATTDFVRIQQQVESVRTFAGQTTTYSFWARATSGTPQLALTGNQGFGTGGSPSALVQIDCGTITLSTSWTRYSVTCVFPSIAGKTLGTNNDDAISFRILMSAGSAVSGNQSIGVQNYTFETWGHQWEAGSIATPFQLAGGGNPQPELALCQRYYWRALAGSSYGAFGNGFATSTTDVRFYVQNPVLMRSVPISIDSSSLTAHIPGITAIGLSNVAIGYGGQNGVDVSATATGLTANRPYLLSANNNVGAYIGFSAEL